MPTIISQNLRRLCMVKELTYPLEEGQTMENVKVKTAELSRRSGVSERTIGRILAGEHVPDGSTTIKLEKALGQVQNTLLKGAIETSNKHLKEFRAKQGRKDFTKFERELSKKKVVKLDPKDTVWYENELLKLKSQIIWAICLTAAFILGLHILLQLLPNPWR